MMRLNLTTIGQYISFCFVLFQLTITSVHAGTVSGLITSDTTWDVSGSPYFVDGTVQVAYGVTLRIEAGVQVQVGSIDVFGTLDVTGTDNAPVVFEGVTVKSGNNTPTEPALIQINYAEFNGGSLQTPTGNASYFSLILRDSVLQDTSYMYLWYPVANSYIERNIFINAGGISVGTSDGVQVYIRNNYFYGQTEGYAVENWASYSGSMTVVEANSFVSNDRVAVRLPSAYTDAAMTAYNNYWGTLDEALIEQMIFDKNDDLASADYIPYIPYLTDHHPSTPIPISLPPVSTPGGFPRSNILIDSDTIWNASGSPYDNYGVVQVAYGVTLRIEAGVQVQVGSIDVFGTLDVTGTDNAPVVFEGVTVKSGNNTPTEPALIQINYAEFNGGSLQTPTGNASYFSLILRDSVLQDTSYMYLWYPVANSYIERNIFINAGGISVGTSDGVQVYIRNNYFYGQTEGYAVENWASYSGSMTVVEANSFVSNDRVAVRLPSAYTDAAMTAYNNYWGTLDEALIEQMIFDKNDDLASADYIPYIPYLTDHHPSTPVLPDSDSDNIPDFIDNCPSASNPTQTDSDYDNKGDACDSDDDNDGVLDQDDAFPLDSSESIDTDNDGVGDNADSDDDNDGVLDQDDAFPLDPTRSVAESGGGGGSVSLLSLGLISLLGLARRKMLS